MTSLLKAALALVGQEEGRCSFWVRAGTSLRYEHEPSGGGALGLTTGPLVEARAQDAEGRVGSATGPAHSAAELTQLLRRARQEATQGPVLPPAEPAPLPLPSALAPAPVSADRARSLGRTLATALADVVLQAILIRQHSYTVSIVDRQGLRSEVVETEELLVRAEAWHGAVVDGVRGPLGGPPLEVESLAQRLREQLETLGSEGQAPTPSLPLVLRPAVSGALLGGLAWMLGGDVARSSPALVRGLGKKLFPSLLTAVDRAGPRGGTGSRRFDDEGIPCADLTLVEEGVLRALLHSRASGAALSQPPSGRGFFREETGVGPAPLNLTLLPTAFPPLERYLELTARAETFTTQPQPGVLSLIAGGWEVSGETRRRIGPLELELPFSATLRRLIAVGDDARWTPSFEGVLAPTLVFGPGWQRLSRGPRGEHLGPLRYGV